MSIEWDRANAEAALQWCRQEFSGWKIAGHELVVEGVPHVPDFPDVAPKGTGFIIALSIKVQQRARPLTLIAVQPGFHRFVIHYRLDDGNHQRHDQPRTIIDLQNALEFILEGFDRQYVENATARHAQVSDV